MCKNKVNLEPSGFLPSLPKWLGGSTGSLAVDQGSDLDLAAKR